MAWGKTMEAASPGQVVTYTIAVANDRDATSGSIVVTDTLAPGLVLVEGSIVGTHTQDGHTITWQVGTLEAGGVPQTLSFSATLPATYPHSGTNEIVNTAIRGRRRCTSCIL